MNDYIIDPFSALGIKNNLLKLNVTILLYALISCFFIIIFCYLSLYSLKKKKNIFNFTFFLLSKSLYFFIYDTVGSINKSLFNFALFSIISVSFYNLLVLIPHCEEPTKNLSVTFAFAFFAFIMIHYNAYKIQGYDYFHHWIKDPVSVKTTYNKRFFLFILLEKLIRLLCNIIISLIVLPFELISRLSLILSLSFRLFGNMFAGAILMQLVESFTSYSLIAHFIGLGVGIILAVKIFSFFEGIIQAGVFVLIALNNITILVGDTAEEKKEIING